jgi:hypothetical protein
MIVYSLQCCAIRGVRCTVYDYQFRAQDMYNMERKHLLESCIGDNLISEM